MSKVIGTRKFYDKHLTTDLVLDYLQYHPDLATQIASTVSTAIETVLADGRTLPPPGDKLMGEQGRRDHVRGVIHTMSCELPITLFYQLSTAQFCVPIVLTLALHPKMDR